MRKTLAIILALALCFGITACAEQTEPQETPSITPAQETSAPPITAETTPVAYTYKVTPMQNVDYCVYYPYGANVPNSSDPEAAWGKITVWTQCPKCYEENVGMFRIDPAELDFSKGDTIQYSDIDSCFDCNWNYNMEQFMWVISITRVPE